MNTFKVCWTDGAVASLEAIVDYVLAFDPDAAADLAGRLCHVADSLDQFPNRGRPRPDETREILSVRPYALRYRVVGGRVEIMRIRDLRRLDDD